MSFLFFLLMGLVGYFEYKNSGNFRPLVVGAICFSVSSGIRYEAWIFFPFLCLLLVWPLTNFFRAGFWPGRKVLGLALFVLLGGAWLIFWSVFSWAHWGDPLHAVHLNKAFIQEQSPDSLRPLPYRFSLPVGVLLLSLSPLPFAGALYVLATILSGMGISEFCSKLRLESANRLKKWVFATMVLTQVAILGGSESRIPYNEKLASVSARLRYPHYLKDAAQSLKPHLNPSDAIILDSNNFEDNIFAHALGLPLHAGGRVLVGWATNSGILEEFVRTRHPRFLVYSDGGVLRLYLDLPGECAQEERIGDMRLDCFYSNEVYRVFRIRYSGDPSLSATLTPTSLANHPATPNIQLQWKGNAASERAAALREARPPQSYSAELHDFCAAAERPELR